MGEVAAAAVAAVGVGAAVDSITFREGRLDREVTHHPMEMGLDQMAACHHLLHLDPLMITPILMEILKHNHQWGLQCLKADQIAQSSREKEATDERIITESRHRDHRNNMSLYQGL
jgi:hypothetical protein